jgi:putative flippase GtrA
VSNQEAVATADLARSPDDAPARPRGAGWRFGATGVASSVVYGLVVAGLGLVAAVPVQVGHLVGTAVSTMVASAMHRRFTFRATRSASWQRSQAAGGGTALLGIGVSTLALTVWQHVVAHPTRLEDVVLVYAVNGVMGLVNFFVMRHVLRARSAAS